MNFVKKYVPWILLCLVTYNVYNGNSILETMIDLKQTTIQMFNTHTLKDYKVYSVLQSHDVRMPNDVFDQNDFSPFCRHPSTLETFAPFKSHLRWNDRVQNSSMLRTQANISRFHLIIYKLRSKENYIGKVHIQTFDRRGSKKQRGGDSWRVRIIGESIRSSFNVRDKADGTYTGWFPVMFPGTFTVDIVLEYSNYQGMTDPPDDWFTKGSIQGRFQPDDIIGPVDQFLNEQAPTIQFHIPGRNSQVEMMPDKYLFGFEQQCHTIINTACGFWKESDFKGYQQRSNDVILKHKMLRESTRSASSFVTNGAPEKGNKKLDTFWIYGDSQGRRFYWSVVNHKLCRQLFKKCDHTYTWTYKHFSPNSHDDRFKFSGDDFNESRILNDIEYDITRIENRSSRSVLLINFGLHIILSVGLERSFRLFDSFLDIIQRVRLKHRLEQFPLIIWKTTTLPVLENVSSMQNATGVRFMTKQRVEAWNSYTIDAACKANLHILAVHNHQRACPFPPVDWVHFELKLFRKAEDELMEFLMEKYVIQ